MTTCPRCGRTFETAFKEGTTHHPNRGGRAVPLAPGDKPPAHFVEPPEPGKPLPHRCWPEKGSRDP